MNNSFDPADMAQDLEYCEMPRGSDRRAFMMRSALAISVAARTNRSLPSLAASPAKAPPLDPKLNVVRKSIVPVMTTVEEFY